MTEGDCSNRPSGVRRHEAVVVTWVPMALANTLSLADLEALVVLPWSSVGDSAERLVDGSWVREPVGAQATPTPST